MLGPTQLCPLVHGHYFTHSPQVAWLLMVIIGLVCTVCCLVFSRRRIGNEAMSAFLSDFFFGIGYSFGIVEPLEILLIAFLPFVMNNRCTTELRVQYNNLFG